MRNMYIKSSILILIRVLFVALFTAEDILIFYKANTIIEGFSHFLLFLMFSVEL